MGNDCCACVSHSSMRVCVCVCGLPVCGEPAVGLRKAVQIIVATVAPAMPRLTQVALQSGIFPLNRSNGVRWKPSKNRHLQKRKLQRARESNCEKITSIAVTVKASFLLVTSKLFCEEKVFQLKLKMLLWFLMNTNMLLCK